MKRKNRDHPDKIIFKIGQNTEKRPGELRRFAVTPVKYSANADVKSTQGVIIKNVASNIEQVLAAISIKALTMRPPPSHHENYPS